jgi:hypothetical protein
MLTWPRTTSRALGVVRVGYLKLAKLALARLSSPRLRMCWAMASSRAGVIGDYAG